MLRGTIAMIHVKRDFSLKAWYAPRWIKGGGAEAEIHFFFLKNSHAVYQINWNVAKSPMQAHSMS